MKKLLVVGCAALTLGFAGCTAEDRATGTGAVVGGLGGAAIGAAVGDTKGAVIGGAVGAMSGAVVGNMVGRSQSGDCIYQDPRTGRRYVAACPR
ncbi:glycine zipper domain-containing protein [Consotaella salsifontis]|uniref:Glycine zipper n=1 Tax=Consotaella salsifontis TaxID=1365950 RepID=A0A1T4NU92_9HYPH|nr:glycine zipper domain-containing protein [Consotaella salsifontis]SJZ82829.1 Glycine zipper [Consotaella salsifontis]